MPISAIAASRLSLATASRYSSFAIEKNRRLPIFSTGRMKPRLIWPVSRPRMMSLVRQMAVAERTCFLSGYGARPDGAGPRSVAIVTGETFQHSNEYFNGCLDGARSLMAKWYHERDPFYAEAFATRDHGLLIDRLQEALSTFVVAKGMRSRSMEYVRQKVASWIVATWNPAKVSGMALPSRGRLRHVVSEIKGVKERQAVAGRHTAATRADKTIARLVEAWDRLAVDGEPSKSALAKESGLTRQTVHNRLADLQVALSGPGVKNAVMLYGRVGPAHPEKSHRTQR